LPANLTRASIGLLRRRMMHVCSSESTF
jgi:hypothetical protein